jgi:flagellar hook-length control protein FliK
MPSAQATAPATAPLPASVSQQIVAALSQVGAGQVDVALSPEELGRVRLSLSVSDTGIAVHVAAERPETLALIRRHIDMLAQDFRAIGYDSVEFGFSDQPGAGRDGGDARRALGNGALLGAVADAPAPRPQITLSAGLAGGLDLRL